jgi:hypothetical protein
MAFVTLEDLQGEIELVVFPRTWEQSNELIAIDRIVMAEGRVDAQASQAKVLVDSLTVDLKVTSLAKPVAQPSTLRNGYSAPLYIAEGVLDPDSLSEVEDDQPGLPADSGNEKAGISEPVTPDQDNAIDQDGTSLEPQPFLMSPSRMDMKSRTCGWTRLEDGWEETTPPSRPLPARLGARLGGVRSGCAPLRFDRPGNPIA